MQLLNIRASSCICKAKVSGLNIRNSMIHLVHKLYFHVNFCQFFTFCSDWYICFKLKLMSLGVAAMSSTSLSIVSCFSALVRTLGECCRGCSGVLDDDGHSGVRDFCLLSVTEMHGSGAIQKKTAVFCNVLCAHDHLKPFFRTKRHTFFCFYQQLKRKQDLMDPS